MRRQGMNVARAVFGASLLAMFAAPMATASTLGPRLETMVQLGALSAELNAYRAAIGSLPATSEGLAGIASDPRLLTDVWGNDVRYIRVAGGFWLMSWGADGVPGGEGDSADVVHIAR